MCPKWDTWSHRDRVQLRSFLICLLGLLCIGWPYAFGASSKEVGSIRYRTEACCVAFSERIRIYEPPIDVNPQSRWFGVVARNIASLNHSLTSVIGTGDGTRAINSLREYYSHPMLRGGGNIIQAACRTTRTDPHENPSFFSGGGRSFPFILYQVLNGEWVIKHQRFQLHRANKDPCTLFKLQGILSGLNASFRILGGGCKLIYGIRHSSVNVLSRIRELLGSVRLVSCCVRLNLSGINQFLSLLTRTFRFAPVDDDISGGRNSDDGRQNNHWPLNFPYRRSYLAFAHIFASCFIMCVAIFCFHACGIIRRGLRRNIAIMGILFYVLAIIVLAHGIKLVIR